MSFGFTSRLSALVVLIVGAPVHLNGAVMTPAQARDDDALMRQVQAVENEANNVRHTQDQRTLDQLQALSVHGVRWANCDINAVLANLETWSKEADPHHVGVHFSLKLPANAAHTDILGRPVQRLVCIILSGRLTFASLLMMLSHATNLAYKVDRGSVTFEQWEPDDFLAAPYGML